MNPMPSHFRYIWAGVLIHTRMWWTSGLLGNSPYLIVSLSGYLSCHVILLTLEGQCKPDMLGIILGESCSKLLLHCTK